MSITQKNLEAAFAGESQAFTKYMYFAKLARAEGFEDVAEHFEHTASQELLHAHGHLELLIGKPGVKQSLEMAIEGETYEFTTMYPDFKRAAEIEGNARAVIEAKNMTNPTPNKLKNKVDIPLFILSFILGFANID